MIDRPTKNDKEMLKHVSVTLDAMVRLFAELQAPDGSITLPVDVGVAMLNDLIAMMMEVSNAEQAIPDLNPQKGPSKG